jgi:hypothetical protein
MKYLLPLLALLISAHIVSAQTFSIKGRVMDGQDVYPLPGAELTLISIADSTRQNHGRTDMNGNFTFENISQQKYRLVTKYFGYINDERVIRPDSSLIHTGDIFLNPVTKSLTEVVIKGVRSPAEQNGDTTTLNAGSYKTNPNANAEDLLSKMPGISNQQGTVKAQGEDVKQIFIDGKPFFGEDPSIALKNLPAEVISKIQIYDRMSDQSAFTGFDDGQSSKAINIITKPEFRNGTNGRLFSGYGTDNRYIVNGNINYRKEQRQITLIGLTNNINQQNFSSQDLTGLSSGSGRGPAGPGGPGGGGRGFGGRGGGNPGGQGDNSNNFLVGQQNGIATTNSIGLNYADKWGKKITASGSYFFNNSRLNNLQDLNRLIFLNNDSSLTYNENNEKVTTNNNHRLNLRLEYQIDSSNSLLATPKLSYQFNNSTKAFDAFNSQAEHLLNLTNTYTGTDANGYNFSNNLLWRHKFAKKGRTFSAGFETDLNGRKSEQQLNSLYTSFDGGFARKDSLVQNSDAQNNSGTYGARLNYTEPVSKNQQIQISYFGQIANGFSEKITRSANPFVSPVSETDTALSNRFENRTITSRPGLTYKLNLKAFNISAGADLQHASLKGSQTFPRAASTDRNFLKLLPNAMLTFNSPAGHSLRVYYRSSSNLPSVTQLQEVVDNSNPLQLTKGNSSLAQDFSNNIFIRYSLVKNKGKNSLFAFIRGNYTANYIGTSSNIAGRDSLISENIFLPRGGQISNPANLNGYYLFNSFLTYSFSADSIKSKININAGYSYTRTPGQINGIYNFTNVNGLNLGAVLASNISTKIDFTLSSTANYNIAENTTRPELNNRYFNLTSNAKVNLIFWKDLVFSTDASHYLYRGLSAGFNQSFFLVNAGFGKRIFKNKNGEIKITIFDLLNQNSSISRTVTETYVEDSRNNVLNRYFMLTFLYNFKHYREGK